MYRDPGALATQPVPSCFRVLPAPGAGTEPALLVSRMARVLVVDDLAIFRLSISRALRMLGHTVVDFEQGQNALDRAAEDEFDLALVDVRMPGMDGVTLARRLHIVARGAPRIVMVTAQPEELAGLDTAPGEFAYLQKPFRLEDLCRVVERALGGAAAVG